MVIARHYKLCANISEKIKVFMKKKIPYKIVFIHIFFFK